MIEVEGRNLLDEILVDSFLMLSDVDVAVEQILVCVIISVLF
jgi:hypothetical protein